ncbi:MAG: glycosyltransferase [Saprospiraceae bacterium]|nr:glycosyltransferase [Saprospiraceae bacterium]
MLVSVIIPCYNQAHFLPDAINSVLEQTYTNIEIIVVNDGSTDDTSKVAKSFHNTKLIEKPNGHLSSARNAGIKAAKGNIIVTLDADDKIKPDFITKCLKHIYDYDIISTWLETFGNENRQWGSLNLKPEYNDFKQKNHINCCSMFTKMMWQEIGGYDENMKQGFEDWDFWRRATKKGYTVRIIPEYLFLYRKHGYSMFSQAQEIRDQLINFMKVKENKGKELIDIVCPLGNESMHNDNELKFCLRSIEKHCNGYRNIYVVGTFPRWGNQYLKHIKYDSIETKAVNIWRKILAVCNNPNVSDNFLFINDDYIFTDETFISEYPYYYSNDDLKELLVNRNEYDAYRIIIDDTQKAIPNMNYFDIHKPMLINKQKFIEMSNYINPSEYSKGLLVKSTYCNYIGVKPVKKKDLILRNADDFIKYESILKKEKLFSYHNEAISDLFINFVEENYPDKSLYEI